MEHPFRWYTPFVALFLVLVCSTGVTALIYLVHYIDTYII